MPRFDRRHGERQGESIRRAADRERRSDLDSLKALRELWMTYQTARSERENLATVSNRATIAALDRDSQASERERDV